MDPNVEELSATRPDVRLKLKTDDSTNCQINASMTSTSMMD